MLPFIAAAGAGLCVGSFLNTCIERLPRGMSLIHPRSRCSGCGKTLGAAELIPLLSYLAQRGRCRSCGAPIGVWHPLVEITTAALAVGVLYAQGLTPGAARMFGLACIFLAVAVVDARHRLIPNGLVGCGLTVVLVASPWVARPDALASGAGLLAGGGGFALMRWLYRRVRGREGMGMGDVKLAALMGAALGVWGFLQAVLVGSLAGVATGVVLIYAGRASWQSALPYGAFLSAASVAVMFCVLCF